MCDTVMGYFPEYRSAADVYRDCLYIGLSLRIKQTSDNELSRMMALEKLERDSNYRTFRRAQEQQVVATYRTELDSAVRERYWEYVFEALKQIDGYLAQADERSPYVQDLRKVYDQFLPYVEEAKKNGHVNWSRMEDILDLNSLDTEDE